jgi:hypothetical protein
LLTGTECRGKLYKFNEDILTGKPDPRATWEQDAGVRRKWFLVHDKVSIFDIGCEYGHWTLAAIAQGAQMVYALERDMEYYRALLKNLNENHYTEYCTPLRGRDEVFDLDYFVDNLSYPPTKIQFIRLNRANSEPALLREFLKNARLTIAKYKPALITTSALNGNVEVGNMCSGLNRPYDKKVAQAGQTEYCLINFR